MPIVFALSNFRILTETVQKYIFFFNLQELSGFFNKTVENKGHYCKNTVLIKISLPLSIIIPNK